MAGNGSALFYRVNLPNNDEATKLVSSVLAVLGDRFNSDEIDVDQNLFNASRVFKIGGTYARKSDDLRGIDGVENRPHRRSCYVVDGPIEVVDQ
ncbi:hypothetical protein CA85_23330 [Allorhodopirellula solitaria]|uniref:Uncharacterized protein n=1 Tax=Allorhodopirellula solitaria TaxID=2527987 RepID=A0A5C5Y1R8_9BACT|nr:hypothetical protein CA85_23330 [Allorhodopirellula solitaria]